jgi:hypothetical protein
MTDRKMSKASDTASKTSAEAGEVLVEGPEGVIFSLTPEAAADTSDRLFHSSTEAAGQRVEAERIAEEKLSRLP